MSLALAGHRHHPIAHDWFRSLETERVLFCRISQQGLLRLLTNARVMGPNVLNAQQAWSVFDELLEIPLIEFVDEPLDTESIWRQLTRRAGTGPNFWTDAYLAAFALATGSTVVTFDRAFPQHRGLRTHILATK